MCGWYKFGVSIMIFFLKEQPVSYEVKTAITTARASSLYGSDFYNRNNSKWLGDNLTVDSLFPQWILKAYESDPNNVAIVPIIKNYLRWLLSQEYGYGAQLNWENIRVPLFMNSLFLEAVADFYFPNADFSQSHLRSILPNIRRFLIKSDSNYFDIKGTPPAIKYLICSLLGFSISDVVVTTSNFTNIDIKVTSSLLSDIEKFKPFIASYVVPAGMAVNYTTL
jgi:hypothetical protein